MKVKKAIIPAAGFGTRVLPASKSIPKEMLNLVDKPVIHYIVQEVVDSGIEDILIITNRGKVGIEDYFDRSYELEKVLYDSGKYDLYEDMIKISNMANIQFIRQKEVKGLGHAVYCSKSFVGDSPFAVLYGDDVIISETPACKQLCDVYETYDLNVVGVKEVSDEIIVKCSSLKLEKLEDKIYKVLNMIEKPSLNKKFSNFAILGRCILTKSIFNILENTNIGVNGEIQLTDAMAVVAKNKEMLAVNYNGKRYDLGNKFGTLEAIIEIGLKHTEVGDYLKKYLKNLANSL